MQVGTEIEKTIYSSICKIMSYFNSNFIYLIWKAFVDTTFYVRAQVGGHSRMSITIY